VHSWIGNDVGLLFFGENIKFQKMFGDRYIVERGEMFPDGVRGAAAMRSAQVEAFSEIMFGGPCIQQRSSPLIDRTSTPSISKSRPATAISTGKVVSLTDVLILAFMVRDYQTHPRLIPEVRRAGESCLFCRAAGTLFWHSESECQNYRLATDPFIILE
jgi:hypothetical protein